MRTLILGGDGMLGHQLFSHVRIRHDVRVTLRQELGTYQRFKLFTEDHTYAGVDVRNMDRLMEVVGDFHPEVIVNAVGIVKQREEAKEYLPSIEINSLLPHRLAMLCKAIGARLLHVSTDCVYSGKRGNYKEGDLADTEDLYGKSKWLGEVSGTNCITLRTSIIGRELSRKAGLFEWFLAQQGLVKGYRNAIFSGFTTIELSRIIEKIMVEHPEASGIYHVSSEPISKFDLLVLIKKALKLSVEIAPQDEFKCDRSLDSTKFRSEFMYSPPSWEDMIYELATVYKGVSL
ncbi:MAG: SDR family oxidoreductase [Nitrospirota bacterium]